MFVNEIKFSRDKMLKVVVNGFSELKDVLFVVFGFVFIC